MRRLKSYEGKLATLSVINGALQNENDKLRAVRSVCLGVGVPVLTGKVSDACTLCDFLLDGVRQRNLVSDKCSYLTHVMQNDRTSDHLQRMQLNPSTGLCFFPVASLGNRGAADRSLMPPADHNQMRARSFKS